MSEWKKYKLGEIGTIKTGKTPPAKCTDAYSDCGVPFVTPRDMHGTKSIGKTERYLTKAGLDTVKSYIVPKNSIAVSCIGSDMGKAFLLESDSVTNQQINSLIVNERHSYEFVYYKFSTMQELLKSIAGGSATPILNKTSFSDISIELPDLDTQNEIANYLKYLDDKIHLNTEINQTLEQIAQAIYKSWFVDYEPTRAKAAVLAAGGSRAEAETAAMTAISGKSAAELAALAQNHPARYQQLAALAAAFPAALTPTENFGEIPAGWEVKKVGDIAKVVKGKSYKSSELAPSRTALVTLKSFNRGGGYRLDGLKEYTGTYKSEQEVFAGDLIIAYTDVTQAADVIGKPAMVMSDNRYEHLVISLDVGVVRPKNATYKYFLYCMAMTESFQAHTQSFCTGTTVLHLSKDAVPSFKIAIPDEFLLRKFSDISNPIFAAINRNIEQGKELEKIRDTLLPKLLSGEVLP